MLTAGGVAGASLLLLVLLAAWRSATASAAAWPGQVGCDIWLTARGSDNFVRAGGFIASALADQALSVPGVAAAAPVLRTFVSLEAGQSGRAGQLTALLLGYRGPYGLGGPPALAAGRSVERFGEIVLDRAAAHRLEVRLGDTVRAAGEPVKVVGLSRGTNLLGTQLAFGDLGEVGERMGAWERASFIAVRLAPGASVERVARSLAAKFPQVDVLTQTVFVANARREVAAGIVPLLVVLAALGAAVAAALVALLAQGLVEERHVDVAVLFALGTSLPRLARAAVAEVGKAVLLGSIAGAVAASVLGVLLDRLLPTVELIFRPADVAAALVLLASVGILGALGPVLRLGRIDPLEAFRP